MAAIRVSITIPAPPETVWAHISDISTHVRWMEDAVAIRFTSPARTGVGVTFDCDTRIGPLRLTDRMEVTEWDPPGAMGIRHVGVVTGDGHFRLEAEGAGTRFTWEEDLTFPAWMGGAAGGAVARPLLRRVWGRNLANLRAQVERGGTGRV